jgi:hypothetical protein
MPIAAQKTISWHDARLGQRVVLAQLGDAARRRAARRPGRAPLGSE